MIPFNDLLWQLFLGASPQLDPPLWFLSNLIICSLTIFLICKYFAHKKIILFLLIIISFFFQYTEINYLVFSSLRSEVKWPVGRLLEMLPYACGGMLLASSGILNKYYNTVTFVFIIAILILFVRVHPISSPQGFFYQGFNLFINTLLIFSIFFTTNIENLNPHLKRIILYISEYSLGIYCIHYILLILAAQSSITIFNTHSFIKGLTIYFISLYLSIIIGKIPSKWTRSLVK